MGISRRYRRILLFILKLSLLSLVGCQSFSAASSSKIQGSPVVITAMIQQSRYYSGLKAMIAKLAQEENIIVQCQIIPDDQYLEIMTMKLNSGESADIIDYNIPDIYDRLVPEKFCVDLSSESWVKQLKEPEAIKRAGKIYGFPLQSLQGVHGVIYNRSVFERLGLEEPKSWEEFIRLLEEIHLKDPQITPLYMVKEPWVAQIWMSDGMSKALGQERLLSLSQDLLHNRQKWSGNKALSAVIDYYLSLFQQDYVNQNYLSCSYDMAIDALGTGKAAMHFNGDFFAASVLEKCPQADLGMFSLDMPNAYSEGLVTVNPSSTGFVAYKYGKEVETVKRIFELWSTPEYGNLYFVDRPGFPAFIGVDGGVIPGYLKEIDKNYLQKGAFIPEFNSVFGIAKVSFETSLWLLYLEAPVKQISGEEVLQLYQPSYEAFMRKNHQPGF